MAKISMENPNPNILQKYLWPFLNFEDDNEQIDR